MTLNDEWIDEHTSFPFPPVLASDQQHQINTRRRRVADYSFLANWSTRCNEGVKYRTTRFDFKPEKLFFRMNSTFLNIT